MNNKDRKCDKCKVRSVNKGYSFCYWCCPRENSAAVKRRNKAGRERLGNEK